MKIITLLLILGFVSIYAQERYIDTTKTENYYFVVKQSDRDQLWYQLFHPKDFTIPKEVKCTYLRKAKLLLFSEINIAYDWNDLDSYEQGLILNRIRQK